MSTESLTAALDYTRRGWRLVPVEPGGKRPLGEAWQTLRLDETAVRRVFQNGNNIGLLLGEPSGGVVDLDLDHPLAARALRALGMPETAAYEHAGRPHLLFRCNPAPATRKYQVIAGLGRERTTTMFVEIRSTGAQSVLPPSVHPDGHRYEWVRPIDPAEWTVEDVTLLAAEIATVCLLAEGWASGARHQLALAAAGFLAGRADDDTILRIIEATASVGGDDEWQDRLRAARDTLQKHRLGLPIVGLPTLAGLLGEREATALGHWWPDRSGDLFVSTPSDAAHAVHTVHTVDTETGEVLASIPSDWVRPISALLAQEETDVEWLVDELFSVGASGFIAAEPKVGKSWVGLELAYCLATGTPFLGRFAIARPRRVLFIEEEDPERRMVRRFKRLLRGVPGRMPPPDDRFRYTVRSGFRLDDATWITALKIELATFAPDLVVLDVFNRLHLKDENSQPEMSALLHTLAALTREHGCAFVLIHHYRKSGGVGQSTRGNQMLRGSSALAGFAECSLYLRKGQGRHRIVCTPESKDAPEIEEFEIRMEDTENDGTRLVATDTASVAKEAEDRAAALEAIDALAAAGQDVTPSAVAAALGWDRSKVSRTLNGLVNAGRLDVETTQVGRSRYRFYSRVKEAPSDLSA